MFKIETHLHTNTGSDCGKLSVEEIIEGYYKAGYHGICVTDHFLRYYFDYFGISAMPQDQRLQRFLLGYYNLSVLASQYGIRIYRGAEVRFDENDNDYLLYGWPDWLLEDADAVFSMGLQKFYPIAQQCGSVLIQAHPFRKGSVLADISCVDGVEIYNAHPRHDSRNHLAEGVVRDNPQLICISGSDCHRAEDIGRGGIWMDRLPNDDLEFAEMVRKGQFTCIKPQ